MAPSRLAFRPQTECRFLKILVSGIWKIGSDTHQTNNASGEILILFLQYNCWVEEGRVSTRTRPEHCTRVPPTKSSRWPVRVMASLRQSSGRRRTNRYQVKGSLPPPADISGYKLGEMTASSSGDTRALALLDHSPSSAPTMLAALAQRVASAWVHRGTDVGGLLGHSGGWAWRGNGPHCTGQALRPVGTFTHLL